MLQICPNDRRPAGSVSGQCLWYLGTPGRSSGCAPQSPTLHFASNSSLTIVEGNLAAHPLKSTADPGRPRVPAPAQGRPGGTSLHEAGLRETFSMIAEWSKGWQQRAQTLWGIQSHQAGYWT